MNKSRIDSEGNCCPFRREGRKGSPRHEYALNGTRIRRIFAASDKQTTKEKVRGERQNTCHAEPKNQG